MTSLLVRKLLPTLFIFSMNFGLGKRNLTILNSNITKTTFNINQLLRLQSNFDKATKDKFLRSFTTSSRVLTALPSTEKDNH